MDRDDRDPDLKRSRGVLQALTSVDSTITVHSAYRFAGALKYYPGRGLREAGASSYADRRSGQGGIVEEAGKGVL